MNDYICTCEHIPFMHNVFLLPCQCTYLHEHTLRFGIMMLGLLLFAASKETKFAFSLFHVTFVLILLKHIFIQ